MNKKIVAFLAALLVAGSAQLFAIGIGVQGGANLGAGSGNAAVTFKINNPWVFAVDLGIYNNYVGIGATADWWIANPSISGPLRYYYGVGLAGHVNLNEQIGFGVGARALAGLNLKLLDNFLELYLQVAWQPTLDILPNVNFSLAHFPVAAGIRFWF